MAWTIEYTDAARRSLRKLDGQTVRRIIDFLDHRVAPSENPRQIGQALTGPLCAYWKYRIGDFRVICDIQDSRLIVLVVEIGNRREVYRQVVSGCARDCVSDRLSPPAKRCVLRNAA